MTRAVRNRAGRSVALLASLALAGTVLLAVGPGTAVATGENATNASFEYDGQRLRLAASSGQEIVAETDLPPGDTVTIRMQGTGSSPFLRSPQATVRPNGTVVATVDLSKVPPGATFDAVLLHNGTKLASTTGIVGECKRDCEPTPTPNVGSDEDDLLARTIVRARTKGTATVPLNVRGAATVSIGSDTSGYRLVATVRDGNGDGDVTLRFYPRNVGTATPTVAVSGADSVGIRRETDRAGPLRAATYDLAVRRGTNLSSDPDAVGVLQVVAANDTALADTPGASSITPGNSTGGGWQFTSGLGAVALGGVLAVVGIAVILGVARS